MISEPLDDPAGSASLSAMVGQLTAPLEEGGAKIAHFELTPQGQVTLPGLRRPVVLVRLKQSLEDSALRLATTTAGASQSLHFAAYTEAGATLLVTVPPVDATTQRSDALTLVVTPDDPGNDGLAVTQSALATWVEVVVCEGHLGRLLYLAGLEKQRLRREARVVRAQREVGRASGEALDRHGADLGVPRFEHTLVADGSGQTVVSAPFPDDGVEPDAPYRARLGLFRRFAMPTRADLLALLNGSPARPSAMQSVGYAGTFRLEEEDQPAAVASRLIGLGDTAVEERVLPALMRAFFAEPAGTVPTEWAATQGEWTKRQALWDALEDHLQWPANPRVAEGLGRALLRAVQALSELLNASVAELEVVRAYEAERPGYDLGLQVDIEPLSSQALNSLAQAIGDPNRPTMSSDELEVRVAGINVPADPSEDPTGRWFWTAFGIPSAVMTAQGHLALSTEPFHGLSIEGTAQLSLMTDGVATYTTTLAPGVDGLYPDKATRWDLRLLDGAKATLKPLGNAARVTGNKDGVLLLVASRFIDAGKTEPYDYRVDLEPGSPPLSFLQYEFMMNLLARHRPLGLRVDTRPIRTKFVDVSGNGSTEEMSSNTARRFRDYGPPTPR